MKKLMLFLCGVMAVFAACKPKIDNVFTFNGKIEGPEFEGATVYLYDYDNSTRENPVILDSTTVVNGTFTFSDTLSEARLMRAGIQTPEKVSLVFIAEVGTINGNMTNDSLSGTPLNDKMFAFNVQYNAMIESYYATAEDTTENGNATRDSIEKSMNEMMNNVYTENKTNVLGAYILPDLLMNLLYEEGGNVAEQVNALIDGAAPVVLNSQKVIRLLDAVKAIENTAEGKHYVDVKVLDYTTGQEVMLSSIIEGKVALIDFWASWCRPCRMEIPNVAKIHQKYGKDMVVVSLNVWDQPEAYAAAVKEMNMSWTLVSDTTKNVTDIYGVMGIPQIMLIGADGTILKRNLREGAIEEAVKEALGK